MKMKTRNILYTEAEEEWRFLLSSEYPPVGRSTMLGDPMSGIDLNVMVRPILVFDKPLRCGYGGEGERCLLLEGHSGKHHLEVRMER